jgi:hypothetical protein
MQYRATFPDGCGVDLDKAISWLEDSLIKHPCDLGEVVRKYKKEKEYLNQCQQEPIFPVDLGKLKVDGVKSGRFKRQNNVVCSVCHNNLTMNEINRVIEKDAFVVTYECVFCRNKESRRHKIDMEKEEIIVEKCSICETQERFKIMANKDGHEIGLCKDCYREFSENYRTKVEVKCPHCISSPKFVQDEFSRSVPCSCTWRHPPKAEDYHIVAARVAYSYPIVDKEPHETMMDGSVRLRNVVIPKEESVNMNLTKEMFVNTKQKVRIQKTEDNKFIIEGVGEKSTVPELFKSYDAARSVVDEHNWEVVI